MVSFYFAKCRIYVLGMPDWYLGGIWKRWTGGLGGEVLDVVGTKGHRVKYGQIQLSCLYRWILLNWYWFFALTDERFVSASPLIALISVHWFLIFNYSPGTSSFGYAANFHRLRVFSANIRYAIVRDTRSPIRFAGDAETAPSTGNTKVRWFMILWNHYVYRTYPNKLSYSLRSVRISRS